jgi:hypothetical protein
MTTSRLNDELRGAGGALAVIAWTLAALALAARWRLAPPEWPFAWPGPGAGALHQPWPALLAAAALLTVAVLWRRAGPGERRAFAFLLLWPAAPVAGAWLALPLRDPSPAILAALVAALAALAVAVRRLGPAAPSRPRRPWHAGRAWRLGHGLALAAGLGVGIALGGFGDLRAVGLSLLLYPLYAALQLTLLLVLPWPSLIRVTRGRAAGAVAMAAALFALVHWPNPLLVVLTGAGMVFWAREYARGRPVWALAVSMGLLATLAAQGLPDTVNHHMRVGPAEARLRAVPALAETPRAHDRPALTGAAAGRALLAELYPPVVGREATAAELDRWQQVIAHERRCFLAWRIYGSPEAARRGPHGAAPGDDGGAVWWTDLAAPWPERIRACATAGRDAGGWRDYLAHCYREILGRRAAAAELAAWDADLGPNQYESLVWTLLERRRDLSDTPFDTLASDELRFWR